MCAKSQLRKEAEKAGLSVVKKSDMHYQITGGALLVNYYPTSKKKTAHVAGTKKGIRHVTPAEAVAMANKAPKKVSGKKKRKQHKSLKGRMFKKQKGLCCWCSLLMVMTSDDNDPLQATIEHVIPLARGGLDNANNIKIAHKKCNNERSCDMPEIHGKKK